MKIFYSSTVVFIFISLSAFAKPQRQPSNDGLSYSQVQHCEGTEAFGSEGQGVAVSALINFSNSKNDQTGQVEKKCELGLAFSYEYGNERGFKFGRFLPYAVYPVPAGKTECSVFEDNGEIYLTLTKAQSKTVKPGRPLKILIDRCKLTMNGN